MPGRRRATSGWGGCGQTWAILAALVLLPLVDARSARADLLQDLGGTFQGVAQELAVAFPKVETRITAVEGDQVRIEGAGAGLLRPGLELMVYRKGELFRHPITNQPLGQSEEEVATVVVTELTPAGATARVAVTAGGRVPVVGDGARITAGRMTVAVLIPAGVNAPFETADQTALLLVARFSALLEKTGRFLTVEPRRILETVERTASSLEAARRLRVPAVLATRLVQDGGVRLLETTWISGRTGATLVALRTPLTRATFPPRFAWEQTPELERRIGLDGPVRGLALADLDGDGRGELVLASEQLVTVHRWRHGGALDVPPDIEFRAGGLILSVDAADLNGTGRAQVVVVTHGGGGRETVRSRVLELNGGVFRSLHDVTESYLRVIRAGKESWLVEQEAGDPDPFSASIRRLVWRDGRYRAGPTLRVPRGVSVYGLALMRLTDSPEPDIVALTPEDRLAVWSARGQRLWTSPDSYGGPAIAFPHTPAAQGRGLDPVIGRVLGRVIPMAAEGSDGPEVLVFENLLPIGGQARTFLPRLTPSLFTQGRIHRLRWQDGGFIRIWQSAITDGYVADFAYGDVDGDGTPEVVVGVVPRGFSLETLNPLSRPKGHLVLYELP